jgi:hypothetical protein
MNRRSGSRPKPVAQGAAYKLSWRNEKWDLADGYSAEPHLCGA